MAYEHEHLTGRPQREDYRRYEEVSYAPWLVLVAVVVGLVALIWVFGGAPTEDPGLAPRIDSSIDSTLPGAQPSVIPGAEPVPAAPATID